MYAVQDIYALVNDRLVLTFNQNTGVCVFPFQNTMMCRAHSCSLFHSFSMGHFFTIQRSLLLGLRLSYQTTLVGFFIARS